MSNYGYQPLLASHQVDQRAGSTRGSWPLNVSVSRDPAENAMHMLTYSHQHVHFHKSTCPLVAAVAPGGPSSRIPGHLKYPGLVTLRTLSTYGHQPLLAAFAYGACRIRVRRAPVECIFVQERSLRLHAHDETGFHCPPFEPKTKGPFGFHSGLF